MLEEFLQDCNWNGHFLKMSIFPHRRVIGNYEGESCVKCQFFLKNLSMQLNWNFQKGGGFNPKKPSVPRVWIFSVTTQSGLFLAGSRWLFHRGVCVRS